MPPGKNRKKSYTWTIVVLLAAVLVAVLVGIRTGASSSTPAATGYPKEISPQRAQTEMANGAMLLDVREVDEYTQSHIAGSLLVPLSDLSTRLQELPQNRMIIVVCRTGVRAAQGRDFLLASGFSNVTSMSGGIQAWVAAGYPMESGAPLLS
jgi:rhodanese-related sulfurtransferase